jgi:hypothetical protein
MLTIVSQIQAALEKASPIRKLSDAALTREIAILRPLQELLEPKRLAPPAKAPLAPGVTAPAQGAAAKQSAARSLPLSKGSIYSKRPAALRPIVPAVAPLLAVAVSTPAVAPSVDALAVPIKLRRLLKLRLQLCDAEKSSRERRHNGARKPLLALGQAPGRGQPKAREHLWSCAKDVLLDVPAQPAIGDCHAKPNSQGNWVRYRFPGTDSQVIKE